MDNEAIITLQILEQIENDEFISQRALAGKLNVSLGLVNSFVKRLVKKGYIKVTTIPKNRILYLLTPKGASEKATLTYEYIKYSFSFYKKKRKQLVQLFDNLYREGVTKIALYGVTEIAEIAYISIKETPITLVEVYDDKVGKFMEYEIKKIENLEKDIFEKIIITEIQISHKNIEKINKYVHNSKIIKL